MSVDWQARVFELRARFPELNERELAVLAAVRFVSKSPLLDGWTEDEIAEVGNRLADKGYVARWDGDRRTHRAMVDLATGRLVR